MQHGLGCNPDNGQLAMLDSRCSAVPASVAGIAMPAEVVPPLGINDQLRLNSCCGNAVDKVGEFDHWAETGLVVDLSARYAYVTGKMLDGSVDVDNGLNVGAAGLAVQQFGYCTEEVCPYWKEGESYSTSIPQAAFYMGGQHRLGAVTTPASVDQMLDMIGTLQGATWFGIEWYESLANLNIGPDQVVTQVSGGSYGGHALAVCGYKTIGGQRVPQVFNSHRKTWNRCGFMLMDPDLFWRLVTRAPYGIRTGTKLPFFKTRTFKHRDGGYC